MSIKKVKIIYFLCLIVIPIIFMLIKKEFFYAGIWSGIGGLIIFIEKNKKAREFVDKLF